MTRTFMISRIANTMLTCFLSVIMIFSLSFMMVKTFRVLSNTSLDEIAEIGTSGAEKMTGVLFDDKIDDFINNSPLANGVRNIVYGFENDDSYSLDDAVADTQNIFAIAFGQDVLNAFKHKTSRISSIFMKLTQQDTNW